MPMTWHVTLTGAKTGGGTVECRTVEPADVLATCRNRDFPTDWTQYRPNSFTCRLGIKPDSGFILLPKATLDQLDRNVATHSLTFAMVDRDSRANIGTPTVITGLLIGPTPPLCLTPQKDASGVMSPTAVYLVQLSDIRTLAAWHTTDRCFNVRCISGVDVTGAGTEEDYYSGSVAGASDPHTWSEAIEDLWGDCAELGSWPGLPYSPAHYPENFEFRGVRALSAIGVMLERIGCEIKRNRTTGAFTIVRMGETDSTFTDLMSAAFPAEQFDIDAQDSTAANYARIPASVRVHFRRQCEMLGGEHDPTWNDAQRVATSFSIAVTAASLGFTTTGVLAGTEEPLWGETTALFVPGGATPDNNSELTQVAQEIAAAYYRRRLTTTRLSRTYLMVWPFEPGSMCRSVSWVSDTAGSIRTEIVRQPHDRYDNIAGMMDDILHSATHPLNLSRPDYPEAYPRPTVWVVIDGDVNGDGYYSGAITNIGIDGTQSSGGGACWVLPATDAQEADWWYTGSAGTTGPWLGLLSGRVNSDSSFRPLVIVGNQPFGLFVTTTGPVTGLTTIRRITFPPELDPGGFGAGDREVTFTFDHSSDEIDVWQDGVPIVTTHAINFVATASVSPSVTDVGGVARVEMQAISGGPYVPESDVATAPAADKIMRADANGTHTFTPPAGNYAGLNVGPLAGDPANPAAGDIHYNSSVGRYKIYR